MVDISNIKNIVVIGAGLMGSDIAQSALMVNDFEQIVLNDIKKESIEKGVKKIEDGLKISESKDFLDKNLTPKDLMTKLIKEIDLKKAVSDADFVIEAVPEDLKIKQEIFRKLGEYSSVYTILASNTSSIRVTVLGEASNRPEKVIGMHFFFPPYRQRGIELMKGEKTSEEAIEIGIKVGQKLPCFGGKRLVVRLEKESPGFIVNRLLLSSQIYLNWIWDQAYSKSIPWEQIDADAGPLIQMGPCELSDYLGLDTSYKCMKYFEENFSPDFTPGKIIEKLVSKGHLGKKQEKDFLIGLREDLK